jgi:hypothetical protein
MLNNNPIPADCRKFIGTLDAFLAWLEIQLITGEIEAGIYDKKSEAPNASNP